MQSAEALTAFERWSPIFKPTMCRCGSRGCNTALAVVAALALPFALPIIAPAGFVLGLITTGACSLLFMVGLLVMAVYYAPQLWYLLLRTRDVQYVRDW